MHSSRLSARVLTIALVLAYSPLALAQRALVWADEFNGPAGAAPDAAKWGFDLGWGQNGWGNSELETYTDRRENVFQDGNGHLVIRVLKENFTGADGLTRGYTSARLVTRGKFTVKYGRVEARLRIPFGQGIWPAFWMLGDNVGTVGWPECGEIDIMENIGREPAIVHASLHGPGYSGAAPLTDQYSLPDGKPFADDFHVFAVEWDPRQIRFYVDETLYQTRGLADLAGKRWVYDHPFYLLLNVAVGGAWPGNPDAATTFPQTMMIDYVRVYSNDRTPIRRNR